MLIILVKQKKRTIVWSELFPIKRNVILEYLDFYGVTLFDSAYLACT